MIVTLQASGAVALVTIDNPPVNALNGAMRRELLAVLEQVRGQPELRSLALVCAGKTFISGADINEFSGPPQELAYRELFAAIEGLQIPVVAGMHGTVLGGGLELALACHYRVAVAGTRFGLPEVTLGIIPGGGGTQRMPRLIGVERTLDLIVSARPVDVAKALELGFLDAAIEGEVRAGTIAYAEALVHKGVGPRRTCDRPVDPASAAPQIIERLTAQARAQYPHRQAALTAIEAVAASAQLPFLQGLDLETELVNRAKRTVESKALVHVFFAERETRKVPGLPADVQGRPVARAGVIGAGTMGSGIAICFANVGLPVTLIDSSREALERGRQSIWSIYDSMVKRGRITVAEKDLRIALIQGELEYAPLAQADVIIEAVFEDLALKRSIFAKLDAVAKPEALLATNTSTLDVAAIAQATQRPQDVIGLHFFSPANVMPLLEVVRTDTTSAQSIRTALDLARVLKKTPVLARVCYGFIGNRMMEGYAREAQRMVLEGATPRRVDGVLEDFGMAMGILAVFDMAGIDVSVNVHRAHADRYPPDPAYYQADFAMHAAGRLGQKSGRGYYRYVAGDRTRHDDPEGLAVLQARAQQLAVPPRAHTDTEILDRCLLPLINEGIRILEEGVAMRASDIDVVWTSGYGFPRFRGGPMFYADTLGLKRVYEGMLAYQELFGPMHWQPAPLLARLAREGRTLADWDRQRD
ncbi:MAG TPA: 3-hydroxyacyl-CoA dehydrogenase NAD-binding domain-containing protein [Steroidobacteraceae bacterium]